jgi:hypothetical protein
MLRIKVLVLYIQLHLGPERVEQKKHNLVIELGAFFVIIIQRTGRHDNHPGFDGAIQFL